MDSKGKLKETPTILRVPSFKNKVLAWNPIHWGLVKPHPKQRPRAFGKKKSRAETRAPSSSLPEWLPFELWPQERDHDGCWFLFLVHPKERIPDGLGSRSCFGRTGVDVFSCPFWTFLGRRGVVFQTPPPPFAHFQCSELSGPGHGPLNVDGRNPLLGWMKAYEFHQSPLVPGMDVRQ